MNKPVFPWNKTRQEDDSLMNEVYGGPEMMEKARPDALTEGVYAGPEQMPPEMFMTVYAGPEYFNPSPMQAPIGAIGTAQVNENEPPCPAQGDPERFCPGCGAPRVGGRFCSECGREFPQGEDA